MIKWKIRNSSLFALLFIFIVLVGFLAFLLSEVGKKEGLTIGVSFIGNIVGGLVGGLFTMLAIQESIRLQKHKEEQDALPEKVLTLRNINFIFKNWNESLNLLQDAGSILKAVESLEMGYQKSMFNEINKPILRYRDSLEKLEKDMMDSIMKIDRDLYHVSDLFFKNVDEEIKKFLSKIDELENMSEEGKDNIYIAFELKSNAENSPEIPTEKYEELKENHRNIVSSEQEKLEKAKEPLLRSLGLFEDKFVYLIQEMKTALKDSLETYENRYFK